MKHFYVFLLFFVSITAIAKSDDKEPTLDETFNFIQEKFTSSKIELSFDDHNKDVFVKSFIKNQNDPCLLTGRLYKYVEWLGCPITCRGEVNLDIHSLYDTKDRNYFFDLKFNSINFIYNKCTIEDEVDPNRQTECNSVARRLNIHENNNVITFSVSDPDNSGKLTRAFKHYSKLCGAKPELF